MEQLSFAGQVVVLGWVAALVGFFWTPLSSCWSRRHERQADQFAIDMVGSGEHLASGLVKMARENLSHLFPHPWYAFFYFSHPPLVERVLWLGQRKPKRKVSPS
ncbi:MAG: M48 family metalloprotease [Candidatus Marinimicrobia bacterium]|nr:M48 family metalloprotease [Candidatus Neomarinimicrobiota bacterium]